MNRANGTRSPDRRHPQAFRLALTWSGVIALSLLWTATVLAQSASERIPLEIGSAQIHSGHSLTDGYMNTGGWPGLYSRLLNSHFGGSPDGSGPGWSAKRHSIPGSSMQFRWENRSVGGGSQDDDARTNATAYEVLVITENNSLICTDHHWYSTWVNHAWANGDGGSGAETVLYTVWRSRDGQTAQQWRAQLDTDESCWRQKAEHADGNRPQGRPPTFIMPGNRLMARVYDDIQAGLVPGVSTIDQIFMDDVHVNGLGSYMISLGMIAMLHHYDVRQITVRNVGQSFEVPTPAQAEYFRNMVWDVLTNYPRSGMAAEVVADRRPLPPHDLRVSH